MITIQAQLAKKLPIPGSQFSSQQASITISAEVTDLNQVVAEAARLYSLAEKAVDAQLAGAPAAQSAPVPPSVSAVSSNQPLSLAQRPAASQPYRSGSQQRRGPAPVTDSQLRFLDRLIQQTGSSVPATRRSIGLHRRDPSPLNPLHFTTQAQAIRSGFFR